MAIELSPNPLEPARSRRQPRTAPVGPTLHLPDSDDAISVILKLAGETCNINCSYCYEKRKPYEGKEFLQPEDLAALLKLAGDRPISLELHGGEPLIVGEAHMRRLFAVVKAHSGPVRVGMQTNGTLLTDRWLDFFEEEWPGLELGVSLDGDPVANIYRVTYRNKPVHERIEEGLRLLERRGWRVGVISVVTRAALGRADAILEHLRLFPSVRYLKFAPCLDFLPAAKTSVEVDGGSHPIQVERPASIPPWATTPMEYADFIAAAYRYWRSSGAFRDFLLEPVASIIRSLRGQWTPFCHFSQQKCAFVLTLYPDGRIGSCDELSVPASILGHVRDFGSLTEVTTLQSNVVLHERLNRLLEKCAGCDYRESCRGGCLATRMRYEGTRLDDEYCRQRIAMIEAVAADLGASVGGVQLGA